MRPDEMTARHIGTVPIASADAIALIEAAAAPGDLFGPGALRCYRRLARLTIRSPSSSRRGARS